MTSSPKVVTHATVYDLGRLMVIPGIIALPAAAISLVVRDWWALSGFMIVSGIGFGLSLLLCAVCRSSDKVPPASGMLTAALAWALTSVLAGMPFYWCARFGGMTGMGYDGVWNALFEGTSAITSCGLTMATHPERLSVPLQWWRSSLQWVGGVGVIVLGLGLIETSEDQYALYRAVGRRFTIGENIRRTARTIWALYIIFTILTVIAFALAGMPAWEAVNHGLTTISTGGMSITPDSFAGYSGVVKCIAMAAIVLSAVSFSLHYSVIVKRRWSAPGKNSQFLALLFFLAVGAVLFITADQLVGSPHGLADSLFQWTSGLCTCGFSAASTGNLAQVLLVFLGIAMFMGGCAGSTAGGLKMNRIALLLKAVIWRLHSHWSESGDEVSFSLNGKVLEDAEAVRRIHTAGVLLSLFVTSVMLGSLALMLVTGTDVTFLDAFFESISAVTTSGLSSGLTGPELPWVAKAILILLMWLGRLEFMSVLVLFTPRRD